MSAPRFPEKVIFAPDVIGASFINAEARAVLEHWRSGAFKIVMNRELLAAHLRVLSQLGLNPELLRRWSIWFTSPERSIYLPEDATAGSSIIEVCFSLASSHGVGIIISNNPMTSPNAAIKCLPPKAFLTEAR